MRSAHRDTVPDMWAAAGMQLERVRVDLPCLTSTCSGTAHVERGILRKAGHPMDGRVVVPGLQRCTECRARTAERERQLAEQQAEHERALGELLPRRAAAKGATPAHPYDAIPPDIRKLASWDYVLKHHPHHAEFLADWPKDPDSIYLFGGVGAGKTLLVACLVMQLLDLDPVAIVAWRNLSIMLSRLRRNMNRPERTQNLIEDAVAADLLVLDDIGAETTTRWVIDQLYVVIEERIEQQRPTVITSNFPISALFAHLLDQKDRPQPADRPVDAHGNPVKTPAEIAAERLISRIRGRHRVIRPLDGIDHRIHGPNPTTPQGDTRAHR